MVLAKNLKVLSVGTLWIFVVSVDKSCLLEEVCDLEKFTMEFPGTNPCGVSVVPINEVNLSKFIILDEATSALDIETEKYLYSLLIKRELSLISVGHRPSLKDFHENILELNGQGDWKLLTSDKYNFKD